MTFPRAIIAVIVMAGLVTLTAMASTTRKIEPAPHAELRVLCRIHNAWHRDCKAPDPAEMDERLRHMRPPTVCEITAIPYRLDITLRANDKTATDHTLKLEGDPAHENRGLYCDERILLEPGQTVRIDARIEPVAEGFAEAISDALAAVTTPAAGEVIVLAVQDEGLRLLTE
ncbi:MAG: hypothetical protein D6761_11405 [Candidatus Dadabacteria bacterium]|nr:MAG: hypothetical protein D6761_11405 [Candidatus Dadabacteria bacterium]